MMSDEILNFHDLDDDQRSNLRVWLEDRLADLEAEQDEIDDEMGEDFIPSVRGLVELLLEESNGDEDTFDE